MAIAAGQSLPDATFTIMTAEGPTPMTTADIFAGKKVLLFAVPGAFTPTCHKNHMPGYVENAQAIKAKGVDTIAVVAVNDVFVMDAWKAASKVGDDIVFLSDGNGDFTKAVGMDLDASGFGMGLRSKRYAMLVEDGTARIVNVEDVPSKADISSAASMLARL